MRAWVVKKLAILNQKQLFSRKAHFLFLSQSFIFRFFGPKHLCFHVFCSSSSSSILFYFSLPSLLCSYISVSVMDNRQALFKYRHSLCIMFLYYVERRVDCHGGGDLQTKLFEKGTRVRERTLLSGSGFLFRLCVNEFVCLNQSPNFFSAQKWRRYSCLGLGLFFCFGFFFGRVDLWKGLLFSVGKVPSQMLRWLADRKFNRNWMTACVTCCQGTCQTMAK